jgi:hypothetical protein
MRPNRKSLFGNFSTILLLILLIGCGPSAQERKANSAECIAAKSEAAKRQAEAELINTEIAASNDTKRRELENLRLEDRLAESEGRPIKNRKEEALLETSISANELSLKQGPWMENLSRSIDQTKIQQACEELSPPR